MNQFAWIVAALMLIIIGTLLFVEQRPVPAPQSKPVEQEYFADEIEVDENSIFFTVKSSAGIRKYHFGGDCQNLSILVHDVPMIGPFHARQSNYKVKISTDKLGAWYVTVWPINHDSD